jgi:outer membrane lipoprotein-sorting protein
MESGVTRWVLALLTVGALLGQVDVPAAAAQSGLDIMEKQRDLHRTRDEEETQRMTLVSKGGETKQRRIVRYTLTGNDNLSKILIRYLAPRDVENTGLLTWEARDGDDDQWLYLPATKKVKRIASSGKKNRFMGTDFAFEDLRPENLTAHKYAVLATETVDGQPCWVIEAVPANAKQAADSGYSKRKLWVRQDNYYTAKREYYDKRDKLEKVQTDRKLRNVKASVWRADEVEMHDVQAGTKTIAAIEKRELDKGLNDSLFTEAELARGGP